MRAEELISHIKGVEWWGRRVYEFSNYTMLNLRMLGKNCPRSDSGGPEACESCISCMQARY